MGQLNLVPRPPKQQKLGVEARGQGLCFLCSFAACLLPSLLSLHEILHHVMPKCTSHNIVRTVCTAASYWLVSYFHVTNVAIATLSILSTLCRLRPPLCTMPKERHYRRHREDSYSDSSSSSEGSSRRRREKKRKERRQRSRSRSLER